VKKTYIILIFIMIYILYQLIYSPDFEKYRDEINTNLEPVQKNLEEKESYVEIEKYRVIKKAEYKIKAIVVSKKNYSYGTEAKFSPVDLALAWGELSSKEMLKKVKFSQSNRWYFYEYKDFPLGKEYIASHSSNHHIVPANKNLKKAVKKIKKGDKIIIQGYLVSIIGINYQWNSSLTRNDTGNGACELVYVENLVINNREYR
jgi:hypothetical protein